VSRDGVILVATRGLRGFADGLVSVLLADYLTAMGYTPLQVGTLVTATLLGSAALTLGVGFWGHQFSRRRLLLAACGLMFATGLGFARITAFWPLLVVAVVGTLNPSAGDVSIFLPTEQAVLAHTVPSRDRTALFGWYNLSGALAGAAGALASSAPITSPSHVGADRVAAERVAFLAYSVIALIAGALYRTLSTDVELTGELRATRPLGPSRKVVLKLSALFSIDSLGGGLVVQSLLVLWPYRRFHLDVETASAVFFVTGILGAVSQVVSPRLARRIGLIRTMVYTHLPSNLLLAVTAFMPNVQLAIACLFLRTCLSQMDVPARQSYVIAVVSPEERPAASSITNVPRSLAAALTPALAGIMLQHSTFGWPLVCAGIVKAVYDILLLVQFRSVAPRTYVLRNAEVVHSADLRATRQRQ